MGDATTTQAGVTEIPSWLQDYIKKILASGAGYAFGTNQQQMTPEQAAAYAKMTQDLSSNKMPTDASGSQWWGAFAGLDKSQVEANAKNQVPNANNTFYTDPATRTPYNPEPQSFVYQNPNAITSLHNDFNNTYKPAADPWAQDQFKPLPAPTPGQTVIGPDQYAKNIKGSTIGAVGGPGSGLPLYPSGPGGSGMPGPENPWYPGAPGWGPSQPTSYGQPVNQSGQPTGGGTTGGLGPGLPGGGIPSAPAAPAAPEQKWGGSSTEPIWSGGGKVDPRTLGPTTGDNGLPFFLDPPKNSWVSDPQIGNSFTGVSQSGNPMQWASQEGADFVNQQIARLTGQTADISKGSTGSGPYSWVPSLEIKGAPGNYADAGAGLEPRQPDRLNVGALANLYTQYSKQEADRRLAEELNNVGIKASTEGQQYAIGNSGNTGLGAPTVHGEMTDAVRAAQQALMSGTGDLSAANKTYYDWYNNVPAETKTDVKVEPKAMDAKPASESTPAIQDDDPARQRAAAPAGDPNVDWKMPDFGAVSGALRGAMAPTPGVLTEDQIRSLDSGGIAEAFRPGGGAQIEGFGPTRENPGAGDTGRGINAADPGGRGFFRPVESANDPTDWENRRHVSKFAEGGILRLLEGGGADQPVVDNSSGGAGGTGSTGTAGTTSTTTAGNVSPNSVYGDLVTGYTPYPGTQVAQPGTLTNNYYAGVSRNAQGLLDPYANVINPLDVSNTSLNYLLNLFQDPQMAISNNIRGVYNNNVANNYTPNMYQPSRYNGNSLTGGAQNQLMSYAQNGGGGFQNVDVNQLLNLVGSYNGGGMAIPSANIQNIQAPTLAAAPNVSAPEMAQLANVQAPTIGDVANWTAPTVAAAGQVSAPGAASANMLSGDWNVAAGPGANSRNWTDQGIAESYMNPYQMAVTEKQKELAKQQRDELQAKLSADAVKAGAFGGSREAVQKAIADRELSRSLSAMDAEGLNSAWLTGQQQFNQDDARAVQAAIANQNAMLDASKASAGYGLQAGMANQNAGLAAQQMSGDWALKAGIANQDSTNQANIAGATLANQAGIASQQTQAQLAAKKGELELQAALGNQSAQADLAKVNAQLGLQAGIANQQAVTSTNAAQAQMEAQIAQANQSAQAQAAVAQMNAAAQASVASQNAAVQMAQLRGNLGLQGMLANQSGYSQSQDRALQALTSGGNMAAQAGLGAAQLNEQSRQFGAGLSDAGFQRTQQFDLDTAGMNSNIQNQIVGSNLNAAGLQGNTAAGMMGAAGQQQSIINQILAQLQGAGGQMDANAQNQLNVLYQNWVNQQEYPMNTLARLAALANGQPYSTSSYQQGTQTQPNNSIAQIIGLLTTAYGASKTGG